MQIFFVIVALSLFVGGIMTSNADANRSARASAESQSAGASLRIFANAVTRFMALNPGVTGSVDLALIEVPYWFTGKAQFSVIIEGGRGFIYVVPGAGGFALTAMSESGAALPITMGVVRNHKLVSPSSSNHTITVPSGVPEGALVYVV